MIYTTREELTSRMLAYASEQKCAEDLPGTLRALERALDSGQKWPKFRAYCVDVEAVVNLELLARAVDDCLPITWPVHGGA